MPPNIDVSMHLPFLTMSILERGSNVDFGVCGNAR